MKVKDFIKMLQEQDPEDFVRISGGAILFAEPKEGYWDGSYSYRDGDKFVISTRGSKVDIHTQDVEDFIWENDGDYSKIKLDFAGYSGQTLKDKIESCKKNFKKISGECKRFNKQSLEQFSFQVLKRVQDGWKIREPKEKGSWSRSMMDFIKGIQTKRMCIGECQAVYKSGFFKVSKEDKKFRFWSLQLK